MGYAKFAAAGGKLGKSSCPKNRDEIREAAVQVQRQEIAFATMKTEKGKFTIQRSLEFFQDLKFRKEKEEIW